MGINVLKSNRLFTVFFKHTHKLPMKERMPRFIEHLYQADKGFLFGTITTIMTYPFCLYLMAFHGGTQRTGKDMYRTRTFFLKKPIVMRPEDPRAQDFIVHRKSA